VPVPIAATPVEDEPQVSPVVGVPVPARLARRASAPPAIPDPLPAPEAPAAPAPPSPTAVEQALLGDILRSLRAQHNPQMALALLDEHAKRFPESALGPEAAMFRAEALLGLGRRAEALRVLDALPLASMPNRNAQVVLRGELRAAAGRWQEARADFDRSLSTPVSGIDAKSTDIMERALWGRASARSRLGDEAGARADLSSYLRHFPSGRFATQAAALLRDSP
jgi:tetratricopeptide (TPR) repeat protein